ncbi:MAG: ACT domain-containing protein [Candidatus Micrarchaeota archaeon]|nr:ACT domain-containing protein [Candidatus Micrarchaeota archaeon]MDE1834376.1 ACT domain-containing protein [Candidatus Micrarchaeota archaeon]MDE1859976.1 ACT domain-containing protein [Candidatus Micrarchaeota archaeon]
MSVSNLVRLYLKNKPYTIEALENGIVNYSALARVVQRSLRIRNYHAIKAALRRYAQELKERDINIEKHATEMLNDSTITIQSGISVIISNDDVDVEKSGKIRLGDYYVYLVQSAEELKKVRKSADIIKAHENASAIIIHSGEKLESLPGFVAYIASLLAEQNINIVEFVSCYTETLIVVSRSDALKSHELLIGKGDK